MPGNRRRDVGRARPLARKRPCELRAVRLHGLGPRDGKGSAGDVEDIVGLAAAILKTLLVGEAALVRLAR